MPWAKAAKAPVGGGVRIAAHNGHARQGGALLRADDVDDALAHIADAELGDAVPAAVLIQGDHLRLGDGIRNAGDAGGAVVRGHVVVRRGQVGLAPPQGATGQVQAGKCLGRGDLMQQMSIDVEQPLPIGPLTQIVVRPNFVVQRRHLPVRPAPIRV